MRRGAGIRPTPVPSYTIPLQARFAYFFIRRGRRSRPVNPGVVVTARSGRYSGQKEIVWGLQASRDHKFFWCATPIFMASDDAGTATLGSAIMKICVRPLSYSRQTRRRSCAAATSNRDHCLLKRHSSIHYLTMLMLSATGKATTSSGPHSRHGYQCWNDSALTNLSRYAVRLTPM